MHRNSATNLFEKFGAFKISRRRRGSGRKRRSRRARRGLGRRNVDPGWTRHCQGAREDDFRGVTVTAGESGETLGLTKEG
jgi:hypothetical protein